MRSQDHATAITAVTSGQYPHLRMFLIGLSADEGTMHIFKKNCAELAEELRELLNSSAKPLEGDGSRDTSTLPPQASEGTP